MCITMITAEEANKIYEEIYAYQYSDENIRNIINDIQEKIMKMCRSTQMCVFSVNIPMDYDVTLMDFVCIKVKNILNNHKYEVRYDSGISVGDQTMSRDLRIEWKK